MRQAIGVIFEELEVWFDPVARSGPEAMALDEVLLAGRELPLLRVYRWDGDWGSVGYFGKLSEANEKFPEIQWVRRWTGGGIVDHRNDWTYSLIVPKSAAVASMKGGESYRAIHEILIGVLDGEGQASVLSGVAENSGGVCFESPVEHDVVDVGGRKIAGAAQRRGKCGLLHQGSVSAAPDSRLRGQLFAESLSESWSETEISPDFIAVEQLVSLKYGADKWLGRR